MKKLTNIDFSKHEIEITNHELVKIYHLKIPGTSQHNIKFINCGGIMAVTGDYGNWIFCREFISGKDDCDPQYMTEKLRILSQQDPYEMDVKSTKNKIQELINSGDFKDENLEYLKQLFEKADYASPEYNNWAYNNCPGDMFEYIPYIKDIKYWLKAVFDGYDHIDKLLRVPVPKTEKEGSYSPNPFPHK